MRGGEFCKFAEIPPGSLVWEIVPIHTSSAKNARLTAREKDLQLFWDQENRNFFEGKDLQGDFQGKRLQQSVHVRR